MTAGRAGSFGRLDMGKNARNRDGDNSETSKLLYALGHERRRQILRVMADDKTISPKKISKNLSLPLSGVSYHTRVLAACGAIELVSTGPAGGSVQHFYRLSLKAEWARQALGLQP
jgi:DNA-binding transcriptional ArsR family regulator